MKKVFGAITNADLFLSGASLVCLVIITFTGVIARYIFNSSYVWGEEAMLSLIIWVIWFGGSALFRISSPVSIEIIVDLLPKIFQIIITVFSWLVGIALLSFLLRQSVNFVELMFNTKRVTPVLYIPKALVYSCIPISCFLMIINMTYRTYKTLRGAGKSEG